MADNGDGTRTGSVLSTDPRAQQQAQSIGATIGGDGWWYAGPNTPGKKQGERILPEEADKLTIAAGTAVTGPSDNAHDSLYRDKEGRAIRGDLWKQGDRSRPIAKVAGTALATAGLGALAAGAGGAAASGATGAGAGATAPAAGGGIMDWLTGKLGGISGTDWLKTIGGAAEGYATAADRAAQRKQQADQFAKTYGLQNNAQQLNVSSQINRAPLADMGQYGAMHVAAPTAFQPRDYTKGLDQVQSGASATGGPQAQLAANQAASAKYTPGAGGVNTDTLKMILSKLQGGG